MRPFEYARPRSLREAVRLLAEAGPEGAVLAGGTDLLALMKDDIVAPARLVSLRDVEELRGIARDGSAAIRIGAAARLEDVARHPAVRSELAGLVSAIEGIRSAQILSAATVGGNLLQRPRCWYFRSGFGLLARKDGRSLVLDGDDRHHAVLGNDGPAYFTSPSSLAVALIALGASVRIAGPRGERTVPLERLYRAPRSDAEREHDIGVGDILAEVRIPVVAGRRSAFREIRQREGLDWPLASAAAALELSRGGFVSRARLVLGHVAPVPWLSEEASRALAGKPPGEESARAAAEAALAPARPLRGNGHKIALAKIALRRAVLSAAGVEGGS